MVEQVVLLVLMGLEVVVVDTAESLGVLLL
jgi:hypothetical protein